MSVGRHCVTSACMLQDVMGVSLQRTNSSSQRMSLDRSRSLAPRPPHGGPRTSLEQSNCALARPLAARLPLALHPPTLCAQMRMWAPQEPMRPLLHWHETSQRRS